MTTDASILTLLGGFLLTVDGERREVPARKVKALVCRLAFDDAPLPRDLLAALLWPDTPPAAARHSLRQALSELRRSLQVSAIGLTVTSQEAALETYGGRIDLREFRTLATSADPGDWNRAMALYRGDLLEGLDVRVDVFDEWLIEVRRGLTATARDLCRALAEHHDDDCRQAIAWTRRGVDLDRLDEAGHRDLMRLLICAGDDAGAIRQYLHCRALLDRELGIAPEPETTGLYEELQRRRSARSTTPAESDRPESSPETSVPGGADPARRLRPAVVLSCQLPMRDMDPERADVGRQQQLELLSRVIRTYGGRVVAQLGGQVVCGFGLGRVHGTEVDRACFAGADLAAAIPGLRGGIASGQVIYRPEDGALVGEAALDAQALAAEAGPAEVRVSRATAAARRYGAADGQSAPLLGRSMQIRQLVAALDASRDGGFGCAILLRGEAGIGKTRLVEEFTALAGREGFAVHGARAYDFGHARAHDPLSQLVRSLLGGDAGAAASLGDAHAPYLQAILGIELTPAVAGRLDSLDACERLRRSTDSVLALVRAASDRSALVLVVEDLHWADRLTLSVLPRLAAAAAELPVVVLMTSRLVGEPLDPEWRSAMGGLPLITLDLQPLRGVDAGRLANALGARGDVMAEVLERAQGNPLFIEQLVRSGRSGRALPHSIQSLAVAQLESLPQQGQEAVRAASVLGQDFGAAAFEAIVNAGETLDAAVAAGLMRRAAGGWRFHHALIRDGIYHNLLPSVRRTLHQRAAAHFRAQSPTLHAQHLDLAESPEAVDALLRAATDEIEHYRLARARQLVRRAREKAPEDARAMLIDAQLELMLGNTPEAADGFRACHRAARADEVQAHALVGLGRALNQMDAYGAAVGALREAVTLNLDDDAYQADAWLQLGNVLFPQGLTDECLRAHRSSLRHATRAGSTLRQARAEGGLGDAHYQQGAMLTAFEHFDRCVRLGEAHGHVGVVPANLAMRSMTLMYQNRLQDALVGGERALALALGASNLRHVLLAHNVLSGLASFHGDVEAGMAHARSSLELAERIGSRRFQVDAQSQIAHLQWAAGRADEARRTLAGAERLLDPGLRAFAGAYVRGLQAVCAESARQRHAALADGERLLGGNALSHCHVYFYVMAMEACLTAGEGARALGFAAALSACTTRQPLPFTDFFIRRTRLLAAPAPVDDDARAGLVAEAQAAGLGTALRLLEERG